MSVDVNASVSSGEVRSPVSTAAEFDQQSRTGLLWVLGLASLTGLLYAGVLKGLVLDWWSNPDYSHGFMVPLFTALVLWREKPRYEEVRLSPNNLGLFPLVGGIFLLIAGTLAAELFTSRFSLLFVLAGMVQFLLGWQMLRAVAFPLGYLAFMIPWPTIVYNQITFPLQLVASRFAAACLELVGIPVFRQGNILQLPNYPLEVAEACSGIRSLLSLLALVVAYLYFAEQRSWVRMLFLALVLPVAVFSNGMRVFVTGILAYHFGPAAAEGLFHSMAGWLVFLLALGLILLSHRLLTQVLERRRANGSA